MSKFMKSIVHSFDFEDDKIRVVMTRLTRGQMLSITPYAPKSDGVDEKGDLVLVDQTADEVYAMLDAGIKCLKENILSFDGLVDGENVSLGFDDICDEQYFNSLMSGMVNVLISESMVVEKKSSKRKKVSTK